MSYTRYQQMGPPQTGNFSRWSVPPEGLPFPLASNSTLEALAFHALTSLVEGAGGGGSEGGDMVGAGVVVPVGATGTNASNPGDNVSMSSMDDLVVHFGAGVGVGSGGDVVNSSTTATKKLFENYPPALLDFAVFCCLLFLLIGVPGNLVTIIALLKCKKVHNATAVFILNLTASDLLFGVVNLPLAASLFRHRAWVHTHALCVLFPLLRYGLLAVSLFSVLAIAINRYVMIAHPRLYPRLYTRSLLALMVLGTWVGAFGALLPTLLGIWGRFDLDTRIGSCTILPSRNGNSPKEFLFLFAFVLPCVSICVCYARIFYIVHKADKKSHAGRRARQQQQQRAGSQRDRSMRENHLRENQSKSTVEEEDEEEKVPEAEQQQDTLVKLSARRSSVRVEIVETELEEEDKTKGEEEEEGVERKENGQADGRHPGSPLRRLKHLPITLDVASVRDHNGRHVSMEEVPTATPCIQVCPPSNMGSPVSSTAIPFVMEPQRVEASLFGSSKWKGRRFSTMSSTGESRWRERRRSSMCALGVSRWREQRRRSSVCALGDARWKERRFSSMSSVGESKWKDRRASTVSAIGDTFSNLRGTIRKSRAGSFIMGRPVLSAKDRRLLRMILVIFMTFVLCYLPITLVKAFRNDEDPVMNMLSYLLVYMTTCINPIIYVVMSSEYRQAYVSLLTCAAEKESGSRSFTNT
ncbi:uncharacterized protein LOC143036571 [Oratosquilla oratoria]|uniref:uncharacterized protein LOC143036571 n=1 Tax=Oratosquilla oratoria TaxID=337810 RepID=UPI003F76628D